MTVCAENRECLLGEIVNGEAVLCEAGRVVSEAWACLPPRFSTIALDVFVVMPNHVHGIIQIVASNPPRAQQAAPLRNAPTLGSIIRAFKSMSAISVNRLLGRSGYAVWQRNYYEHVIRNEKQLEMVRQYIVPNPLRWASDRENPQAHQTRDEIDLPWET